MPLLEEVARKKAREEEEQRKKSNTLPTKSESSYAEKSANTIKNETVAKTDSHSYRQNSLPVRGNDRNSNRSKQNKRNSYNRHRLDDGARDIQNRALSGQLNADEPTRYYTDVHGRTAVDDRIRANNLDDWFNVGGKFLSNYHDAVIDNTVGMITTPITGRRPTDGAYYDNPYEEQRHQGLSARAGEIAGMSTAYGLSYKGFAPLFTKASKAVMNGTKIGKMIQNSAVLGKVGQYMGGGNAQIGEAVIREAIENATLGTAQNFVIDYGQGLRDRELLEAMGKDALIDAAVGSAIEGRGLYKEWKQGKNLTKSLGNIGIADMLTNGSTKAAYLDNLDKTIRSITDTNEGIQRTVRATPDGMGVVYDTTTKGNVASAVKDTSGAKRSELIKEYDKVLRMSDDEFKAYRKGQLFGDSAEETVEQATDNVAKNVEETADKAVTPKAEPKFKGVKGRESAKVKSIETLKEKNARKELEEQIRAENPNTYKATRPQKHLKQTPEETTITLGNSAQIKTAEEATAPTETTSKTKRETKKNSDTKPTREDFEARRNAVESEEDLKKLYKDLEKTVSESKDATKSPVWDIYEDVGYKLAELDYDKKVANRLKRTTSEKGLNKLVKELEETLNTTAGNRASIRETYDSALDKLNKLRDSKAVKSNNIKIEEPSATASAKATADNTKVKAEEPTVKEVTEPKAEKAKAEAEPKAETTPKKKKVSVNISMKKSTIIERGRKAGIDLGEKPDDFTAEELVDIIKGNRTLEDVSGRVGKRASLKDYNVAIYPDYYVAGRKDDLINEFVKDSKNAGEPLSAKEIEHLKSLDDEEVFLAIEEKVVDRANTKFGKNYETLDDYIDDIEIDNELLGLDNIAGERMGTDPYATTYSSDGVYTMTNSSSIKGNGTPRRIEKGDRKYLNRRHEENISKKVEAALPKKDGKQHRELPDLNKNKGRFAALDEPLNPEQTKGKKPQKPKLEKVADLNPNESIRPFPEEASTARKEKEKATIPQRIKGFFEKADREFFNEEAPFARMDNRTWVKEPDGKGGERKVRSRGYQDKASAIRTSRERARFIYNEELLGRNGQKIGNGKSFKNTLAPITEKKQTEDFTRYLFARLNKGRALQESKKFFTKDMFGFDEESAKVMADNLESAFPALADKKKELTKWLQQGMRKDSRAYESLKKYYGKKRFNEVVDTVKKYLSDESDKTASAIAEKFKKEYDIDVDEIANELYENIKAVRDEYLVGSGIISEETAKKWDELNPDYFPIIRAFDDVKGANSLDSPEVVKALKGATDMASLNADDALAIMTQRYVNAAYRNQLNLAIVKGVQDNPELKEFGKFIGAGEIAEDIDEALLQISKSVDDVSEGSRKLTALDNGKRVSISMSKELAASLESIYYAKDTSTFERIGRAITNPIKALTTKNNPLFIVPNLIKDAATYTVQSEHNTLKRTTGLVKSAVGMADYAISKRTGKELSDLGRKYKTYKFAEGNISEFVAESKVAEKSILPSKEAKNVKKAIDGFFDVISAGGRASENLYRFAEFVNTFEKTGDLDRAVRDARKVTVDFGKHGSAEFIQAADAWVMYLNAGLQGLHQMAETIGRHPLRTTGRAAVFIGVPYAVLTAVNSDNPNYWDLSDRTRQLYFCIPNMAGEKDEDGNCKTFIKLPQSKEYGAFIASTFDVLFRFAKGDEDYASGYLSSLSEGVKPNSIVKDNVLAPLIINLPMNTDYKGDKILTSSEHNAIKAGGKYLDTQYDSKTSKAAMKVSEVANKVMGDADIPYLKYLKSPKAVDYLIGSYTGGVGTYLKTRTVGGNENILQNRFVADSRYSSGVLTKAFDDYDKYKLSADNEETDNNEWSEAKAVYYNGAKPVMDAVYDSIEKEKEIKADTTLSDADKREIINDLREARIELAKTLKGEAEKAAEEYKESPTYSSLSNDTKDKWNKSLGISKEKWATTYKGMLEEYDSRNNGTSRMTTDEKRFYLLEHGVTTYTQAQSILGKSTSKDEWDKAVEAHKNGQTYKSLMDANIKTAERQKYMTDNEKKIDNRLYSKYDGKTISEDRLNNYFKEFARVDKLRDDNGSITQAEAENAIENLDQMYGLTQDEKSYLWYLIENDGGWKKQPYGKWNG